MAGNSAFELVQVRGWRGGLDNLLRGEFGSWWKSNTWWVQTLIWVGVINGILAGVLWGAEGIGPQEAAGFYSIFSGLFPTIAVIIILQDAVVGEKESGTASWVLSKPVARTAFILAKLIANTVGVIVTMVVFPGVVAYLQIRLAGAQLAPLNFILGMGVLALNLIFFLTLTLMLGTLFAHRGPVIGIPLALAFGQQLLLGVAPFLVEVLPWILVVPFGNYELPIAATLMQGQPPPTMTPLYAISILIVVFVSVSLWRFEQEEF
jgi:ABC-2 type transport system permease protein